MGLVGAVGIENNDKRSFKDLKEMRGNGKALKRNGEERKGILIGPSMAPRLWTLFRLTVGVGIKFHGTDGKPTSNSQTPRPSDVTESRYGGTMKKTTSLRVHR